MRFEGYLSPALLLSDERYSRESDSCLAPVRRSSPRIGCCEPVAIQSVLKAPKARNQSQCRSAILPTYPDESGSATYIGIRICRR